MDASRRAGEDRQLRGGGAGSRDDRGTGPCVRSRRARRGTADQKPFEQHASGRRRAATRPQLGAHRHAGGKLRRGSRRPLRLRGARPCQRPHDAQGAGRRGGRLCAAAHERQGAHRDATADEPRRADRTHSRTARDLPPGRGGGGVAAVGPRPGGDDPKCVRTRPPAQADLQLRSADGREREARLPRGRTRGGAGKRQEGTRLQPVGGDTRPAAREARPVRCPAVSRRHVDDRPRRGDPPLQARTAAFSVAALLRRRRGRAEPAVFPIRVSLRPLVEPRDRGSGDQPGPPDRRCRGGHGHAVSVCRHDRRTDRRGAPPQAGSF